MMDQLLQWGTHGLTAILGGLATFLTFKKVLTESTISDTSTKAHLEIIEYLKQVKDSALAAEERAKKVAKQLEIENQNLRVRIMDLEKTNDSVRVHNKILSDIVTSLQESLQQTKFILEEQMSINNDLLAQLKHVESSVPRR